MWLKEHNKHYESVPIDTTWLENEGGDYVPVLPCQDSGKDMCNSMPHIGTLSDNDVPLIPCQGSDEDILHSSPHMPGCEPPNNTPNTTITMQPDVRVEPGISACYPDENGEYGGTSSRDQIDNCMVEEENNELIEDQAEINRRQETTGDPLPSVVQFDNLENVIFNCAPGENNIPKYILLDEQFEELAFPDLFPSGFGGYYTRKSECHLPIRKYFQQCLLNVDGRFAKNIEYIFCAQYISDIQHIQSDANLAIHLSRGSTLNGKNITAGLL